MDLDLFSVFDRDGAGGLAPVLSAADAAQTEAQAAKRRRKGVGDAPQTACQDGLSHISSSSSSSSSSINSNSNYNSISAAGGGGSSMVEENASSAKISLQQASKVAAAALSEPRPPAKTYKFELDGFQKQAIACIERDESVLVAAHTSAGKTVCAEYAIAKSLRDKQRVIYTSPIKALSNQKYRDLKEEFGDVGLMTGDVTLSPNAQCIVMTTEILRSMLYRGSEIIREVAWVIYDEVHYMRDKERGVVWEESIILLPHNVKYVFLSATIPNAEDFMSWIAKIHQQTFTGPNNNVVYTDYRPTPLQHFIFPLGADGLYLIVDEKTRFREDSFQKAMACLLPAPTDTLDKKKSAKPTKKLPEDLSKIVRLIMEKDLDPCIIFSFSKKECETYAMKMSIFDFNSEEEKQLIDKVFKNAMEVLSEDDQQLPAVVSIFPLLKKGIGIHHGGLLPILKEVIEILFQEGLIKCLFATETFSIGINMPAKTVVFTSTRKFDGKDNRYLTSGEYIQMSGRAGRRGKDDKGVVIQMIDEKMEPEIIKGMVYGASDPLHSSYHVSYNMLLNMLRIEDENPEKILKCSFYQFEREKNVPELVREAEALQMEAQLLVIQNESVISEYYSILKLCNTLHKELSEIILKPQFSFPFMKPGRLVSIKKSLYPHKIALDEEVWGVVTKEPRNGGKESAVGSTDLVGEHSVELLISQDGSEKLELINFPLNEISNLSAVKLNLPKDFTSDAAKKKIGDALGEIQRRFAGALPLLDAVGDVGIDVAVYNDYTTRQKDLTQRLAQSSAVRLPDYDQLLLKYDEKCKLLEQSTQKMALSVESQSIVMKDDVRKMKRVLRRLGYVTEDGVLSAKGRFACELTVGDEIILTDMVFDGTFNDLATEQIVGMLSCFVFQEGPNDESETKLKPEMQAPIRMMQTVIRNYVKVCVDAKMVMDEEETVNKFNTAMVGIAYAWCKGAKFSEVIKLTEIMEGSIVRAIRRLDELLRQLAQACTSIGNRELNAKFADASTKIHRGVIFTASLLL